MLEIVSHKMAGSAVLTFFFGFGASFGGVFLIRLAAWYYHWLSQIRPDRWAKKPAGLHGGLAMALVWVILSLLLLNGTGSSIGFDWFILGTIAITLFGLFDDVSNMSVGSKLIIPFIITSILIATGWHFTLLPWSSLNIVLTIIWVMGITHSINILDNMDGLAAGIAIIIGCFLYLIAVVNGQFLIGLNVALFIGIVVGFIGFNLIKSRKMYMGDSGSNFLGFYLSLMAVVIGSHLNWSVPWSMIDREANLLILGMVFLVPVTGTIVVIVSRFLGHRPIVIGGIDELSHRLVKIGLTDWQAVLIHYLIALIGGSFALVSLRFPQIALSVSTGLLITIASFIIIILNRTEKYYQKSL